MKRNFPLNDLAVTLGVVTAFLFSLIPVFNWLGVGNARWSGILHGAASTFTLLVACFVMHALFSLYRVPEAALPKLIGRLSVLNGIVLLSIITGNWLYIAYRAPDGAMQWFLMHAPNAHTILMEFKEFISLFPLPLGIAASFILYRFRHSLSDMPEVKHVLAVLIVLLWMCMLAGFVFGIGLAKLRLA